MAEVAGMTGREILQAIIDGKLPQAPISETMSFWINILADTPSASRHVRDRSAMIARYFAQLLLNFLRTKSAFAAQPAGASPCVNN
jgi:hypothetical protein